jgi:hypothetical protein
MIRRERMTRRDALHHGFHLEYLFGPIRVPSREDFVDALTTIARESPLLRVGAQISPDRRSRVQDPQRLREWAERAVRSVPGDGLAHFVDGFAERAADPAGDELMHFTLSDHHVLFSGDHSLGDSGLLMRMAPAVIAVANGRPIPTWLMRPESNWVLIRALWHTFGRNPLQLRAALAARGPQSDAVETTECRPWQPDPTVSVEMLSNERFVALRRAYKGESGRVPATVAMILLAQAAFRAESIEVTSTTWVPIDARRYLPDGIETVGNFAPDVGLSTPAGASAVDVAEQLARGVESARPLLAMSWDSLQPSRQFRLPTVVPARPRAEVSVVTLGLRQEVDGLPWIDRTDCRFYATGPDPDPLAIRCAIMPTRTGATITASYHANVFSREQVEAALARLSSADIDDLVAAPVATAA